MTNDRFIAVILSTIAAFAAVNLVPKSDNKWQKLVKPVIEVSRTHSLRTGAHDARSVLREKKTIKQWVSESKLAWRLGR